ncbi:MAG: hypothetical protein QGG40_12495, partial [Myxococcota bacterium]|nr:hypothetical protein [Myxococcota bacterium]
MNCTTVHAILSGEAPVAPISGHLSSCASCRTLSESLEQVDVMARCLPLIEPPDLLVARVLEAVETEISVHEPTSGRGEDRPQGTWDWI